jgi:hypothetical protein
VPDFFFSIMDLLLTTITTLGAVEGVEGVRYVDMIPFLYFYLFIRNDAVLLHAAPLVCCVAFAAFIP